MSDLKALKHSAVKLLSRREHGRVELEQKLIQRGYAVSDIQIILDELVELDYLNESRYIEAYIRARQIKGYGPVRIRLELEEKAADIGLVQEILDMADTVWYQQATIVCQKKFGESAPQDLPEKMQRMRFLQYRGFTQEQINHAVSESTVE